MWADADVSGGYGGDRFAHCTPYIYTMYVSIISK